MSAAQRAGVVTFAAVLFLIAAVFTFVDGIVALTRPEQLYVGEEVLVVKDYDAWGVGLIVLAGIQTAIGLGILSRARPAQIFGIIFASLGFIAHLAYFRHYPAWSVVLMALNLVVIYALTAHGQEFKRTRR
jgi:hypothetical protein